MSLTTANKDRNLINSSLLKLADSLIMEAKQVGIDLRIFEGYRTNERQDYLFKQKSTSLKGGQSKHNFKPSQAITILEYKDGQPTWGGFPFTTQFKNIVNNLLMTNSSIEWGGNWKNPLVYQFEIRSQVSNKDIVPPPQQSKIIEVTPIDPTIKPTPQLNPMPILKPVSVKMEVDNSSIIILGLLAGALFYFNKK